MLYESLFQIVHEKSLLFTGHRMCMILYLNESFERQADDDIKKMKFSKMFENHQKNDFTTEFWSMVPPHGPQRLSGKTSLMHRRYRRKIQKN